MKKYLLKDLVPLSKPSFRIDYEKEVNPTQLEAVSIQDGPVLVIAGAGSGKTRALVYRLARLVETGVPPANILLLTFTRKAAQEMLRRAGIMIGSQCERIQGGTFHSVANTFLRKYAHLIGYEPGFTILDRADSEDVINLLRTQLMLNEKQRRFPRKNTISQMFSKANNLMEPLSQVIEREYFHFYNDLKDLLNLQNLYKRYKGLNQLMDYDDLLLNFKTLLEDHLEARADISQQFRYIMVDEYQDTNLPQSEIVRLMAFKHNNVMVVGDDSQSIYSFRGANFRNIMEFPNQFPETRIIKLEENYRSTQPILNVANTIIENAREKYTKNLFTRKIKGPFPIVLAAENENYQSRFIAQKVLELREEGVPLNDIAILCRAAFHTFDLEIELGRCNIPYVKYGGFKFVETAHVKDVLAHLRIINNPRDSMSWNRILMLIEKIGPRTSRNIIEWMFNNHNPLNLSNYPKKGKFTDGIIRLHELTVSIAKNGLTVTDQIGLICRYYEPILKNKYDDYPKRIKDLEHLQVITGRYQQLERFLSDVVLEPPNESISGVLPSPSDDERLVLSTIHSAKGLEWNTVFIIWALEGKFPSNYAFNSDEEMEEERRLMYVAATRAKENLFITYPINIYDQLSGYVLSKPSRFIEELSSELVESWNLMENRENQIFNY
ncbi:MAG: ATP-dependent helicase [Proteobacteria bacterium]|nr:ATP-dependent helicase [Pseudomonadota bacterium]